MLDPAEGVAGKALPVKVDHWMMETGSCQDTGTIVQAGDHHAEVIGSRSLGLLQCKDYAEEAIVRP